MPLITYVAHLAFQCRMLLMISKLNKRNAKNQICISHKLCFRFDYRFLPLHLWVELGRGHTVTHRGSFNLTSTFWTFSASAHFLKCFEFFWHKTIFLILSLSSRKNEPIKVTQSFSIDRWRVDSEKESGYESKLLTTEQGSVERPVQDSTRKIERPSHGSLLRNSLQK